MTGLSLLRQAIIDNPHNPELSDISDTLKRAILSDAHPLCGVRYVECHAGESTYVADYEFEYEDVSQLSIGALKPRFGNVTVYAFFADICRYFIDQGVSADLLNDNDVEIVIHLLDDNRLGAEYVRLTYSPSKSIDMVVV